MQLGLPFRDTGDSPPIRNGNGRRVRPSPGAPDPLHVPPPVVFVRRRQARRYVLRVDHDGAVRVTIPARGSRREAETFVAQQREWIARQRARARPVEIDAAGRRSLLARARRELPVRLRELAERHGVTVTRVSIRDQRTRWGSCGPAGHICLNWRLVAFPDWVRDYVLIHELMHLHRLDHSPAYWRLVAQACPEYREARQWLRQHGRHFR